MYTTLLLDADETLFDFSLAEKTALDKAFLELGLTINLDAALGHYKQINKELWAELEEGKINNLVLRVERFRRLFAALNIKGPVQAEDLSPVYLKHLSQGSYLLPESETVCETLSKDCKLIIVTNGLKEVQHGRFDASPLLRFISGLVISDELGVSKPDPRIFDHALKLAGNPSRDSVLVVGDSLSSDIRGGQNAGLATCWYNPKNQANPGPVKPDYEIKSLTELVALVRGE